MNDLGVYIHVPFCSGKCPYCDFYSMKSTEEMMNSYVSALETDIRKTAAQFRIRSVYFGGGTPSLLGADRICEILSCLRDSYEILPDAEITCEVNPGEYEDDFFTDIRRCGVNRVSFGLQSADSIELQFLGRRHTVTDVANSVDNALKSGIDNISLDMMIGLPGGSIDKINYTAEYCASLKVKHISAYILKVEPGTKYYRDHIILPDEDTVADEYLFTVEKLKSLGYIQYEISNFAIPGFEGRHNLIYWHDEEYIGYGPASHSFFNKNRSYYSRSLRDYISLSKRINEGPGGDFEEYAMLSLRLSEGLRKDRTEALFGKGYFESVLEKAAKIPEKFIKSADDSVSLTPEGFLVSNSIITDLIIK
jgi:oxygen-independent coproporphyrinogen-3 oxidase